MISLKTDVCISSQFPTEAMLWINEVEMVDSVDDLKIFVLFERMQMPNFEVLDAKIASVLNRIIHNTQFRRKISLEEQKKPKKRTVSFVEHRSLTWSANNSGSLEPMILSRILQTWWYSGIRFEVGRNFITNDENLIWWHLGRIVQIKNTSVWETQDLYDLEIHQKKLGLDYHRLKTMVKRSIEQEIRNKNFGARSGNDERNAVVNNQRTKQRERRSLGKLKGSVLRRQLQFPTRYEQACKIDTAESFSEFFHAAEWVDLYDLEIHQEKAGPDYHRLKTMFEKYQTSWRKNVVRV